MGIDVLLKVSSGNDFFFFFFFSFLTSAFYPFILASTVVLKIGLWAVLTVSVERIMVCR